MAISVKAGDLVFVEWTAALSSLVANAEQQHVESLLGSYETAGARLVFLWSGFEKASAAELAQQKHALQQLAYTYDLEYLDLAPLLLGDGVYLDADKQLTSIGATAVARRLYEHLKTATQKRSADRFADAEARSSFHGYDMTTFTFEGREAKIVRPKVVAQGKPWVWRARFWGHEPAFDIAMLERGYHIVYCDVAELFGNAESMKIWGDFCGLLRSKNFNTKSVMEGMSRGGIYIYNWLLKHPDRVSAVYADAPVLDPTSWPGGKGSGKGSASDWAHFKQVYSLTDVAADAFKASPLGRAEAIALSGIPLLHVVGDADDIVPTAENTLPFAERIRKAGGQIELIHKPEVGHHPHSLPDPQPIIDFVLRAEGRKINFAAVPAPGAEYRSGAGWAAGSGWWGQHNDIDSLLAAQKGKLDILFVGNSITQGMGGNRTKLAYTPGGKATFDEQFASYRWEAAGIAGDRTQNVLWRLQNGNYILAEPKVLVLSIGVNNFLDGDSAEEIAAAILTMKDWVLRNMPKSKLVLTGPLPVGLTKDDPRRLKYEAIHVILKEASAKGENYSYSPMTDAFVQADGSISLTDYSSDGIHLNTGGYEKWATKLLGSIK